MSHHTIFPANLSTVKLTQVHFFHVSLWKSVTCKLHFPFLVLLRSSTSCSRRRFHSRTNLKLQFLEKSTTQIQRRSLRTYVRSSAGLCVHTPSDLRWRFVVQQIYFLDSEWNFSAERIQFQLENLINQPSFFMTGIYTAKAAALNFQCAIFMAPPLKEFAMQFQPEGKQ